MRARRYLPGALVAATALGLALAVLTGTAESHPGHPQKMLLPERWHYQPNGDYDGWLTLSTSDVWLDCGASPQDCGVRWHDPFDDAMADWNAQPMTVRFDYTEGVRNIDFDVNVFVADDVLGDPGLLGIALPYDQDDDLCFDGCQVYHTDIIVGDQVHNEPPYDTAIDRRATTAHEVGHAIQLRHESVNFDCGTDETGAIPRSIMAYDCIDPVSVGGLGLFAVEPWDVCGVNHAYFDPAFDFAGCDGTTTIPMPTASPTAPAGTPTATGSPTVTGPPTPTPTPSQTTPPGETLVWGDANCSGQSDPIDSLLTLRFDAGLSVNRPAGCPEFGAQVQDGVGVASLRLWGDVDCSGAVNPVDSLKVLRRDAGLSVAKSDPACLDIGQDLPG